MTVQVETQIYEQSGPFRSEDDFQIATARYLDAMAAAGLLSWFHPSPNCYRRALVVSPRGKMAAIRAGARGKRLGIKAGVPDIFIYPHRLTIELKNGTGNYSTEQKAWKAEAEKWGWRCYLAKNPAEVIRILMREGILLLASAAREEAR